MNKYMAIIDGSEGGYSIESFATFQIAYEYATKNNYGRAFFIAKNVEYAVNETENDD